MKRILIHVSNYFRKYYFQKKMKKVNFTILKQWCHLDQVRHTFAYFKFNIVRSIRSNVAHFLNWSVHVMGK